MSIAQMNRVFAKTFMTLIAVAPLLTGCAGNAKDSSRPIAPGTVPDSGIASSDTTPDRAIPEFNEDGDYNTVDRSTMLIATPTEQPEPPVVYTSHELWIEPTLEAACGMKRAKLYFDSDSAEVRDRGEQVLEELATCLTDHPLEGRPITITGHADPSGSESYNRSLGMDRANAVAEKLAGFGVPTDRIDTYSYGESVAPEDPEAWKTARNVVVRLAR